MSTLRPNQAIVACVIMSTVLGSIHAFSVFMPEWETLAGANRVNVSLVYSLALVSLTVAVLFGYRLYQLISPFLLFLTIGFFATMGLWLSALSTSLVSLYLNYGVLFGAANGLGYGYSLQLAGQVSSQKRGLSMGLVTAFYAVGATVAPLLLITLIREGGNELALQVVSVLMALVAVTTAFLIRSSGVLYKSEPASSIQKLSPSLQKMRWLMWVGYGSAVTAGLMVIGHSYGIALWMKLGSHSAALATTVVALGNMLGGFCAGYFADRLSSRVLLRWLPWFSILGLLVLVIPFGLMTVAAFIGLGIVGYCYGAIIAVYPVAVVDMFGALAAPRIYGQIFTAWGLAGIVGPWSSGWLFDVTGSYLVALLIAVVLSGVSGIVVWLGIRH